ncbi:hypothetical protein [Paraburkholderia tropica]|uniref:hypothetical protein n=2 Tax=Paraburkholderia tropica TaxID=92647 RepID=UPI00160170B7|nr:hypothetical protein [Paraburkholderia tropica]MBB2979765.1 hypothetical protein [Paraburkholderia tropica]MBB3000636.1 hypothetical protein [Paraburkholderia tropica]MBB6320265.1 hypothetical protein [Paraburkholderia tropica]QNB15788.1 hypothetical protein G5S35_29915 [Paraburkholderia tropica]
MKKYESADKLQRRETIRKMAFLLSDSGALDDWEAVRRALAARFDALDVDRVLASPFLRLILDQRCRACSNRGTDHESAFPADQDDEAAPGAAPMDDFASAGMSTPVRHQPPDDACAAARWTAQPCLAGDIAALLADGRKLTAAQLAREIGAALRDIQKALQSMLACEEVHVAQRTPRGAGGRSARIFAIGGDTVAGSTSSWAKADPVVLRAMDALVRHGEP